jgi:hypothetical protein
MRKLILDVDVRAHTDDEYSPSLLGHTVMLRVQDSPSNAITGQPVTLELIAEQYSVVTVRHTIDVLDHERLWQHHPQCSIELLIEEIDGISGLPAATLSKPLTGIATHHEFSGRKVGELGDVSPLDDGTQIVLVGLAC